MLDRIIQFIICVNIFDKKSRGNIFYLHTLLQEPAAILIVLMAAGSFPQICPRIIPLLLPHTDTFWLRTAETSRSHSPARENVHSPSPSAAGYFPQYVPFPDPDPMLATGRNRLSTFLFYNKHTKVFLCIAYIYMLLFPIYSIYYSLNLVHRIMRHILRIILLFIYFRQLKYFPSTESIVCFMISCCFFQNNHDKI